MPRDDQETAARDRHPLVMGRGLGTPTVVILIGLIGGTLSLGLTGLFLGPIVLAVIWELLVAWIGERESD